MTTPPQLTDEDMALVEQRLVESGLAKLNAGAVPAKQEADALQRAHARHKQAGEKLETTELGLEVPVKDLEDKLRGKYDLTRKDSQLVNAVTFMLGLPGIRWDVIAKECGIAWETVAAIARTNASSIREFKRRLAGNLAVCLEAATPVLMDRIKEGKVGFLDYKLMADSWLLLSDQATSIVETRSADPALTSLRAMVEAWQQGQGMDLVTPGESAEVPALDAELVEIGGTSDSQSLVFSTSSPQNERVAEVLSVELSEETTAKPLENFNGGGGGPDSARSPL